MKYRKKPVVIEAVQWNGKYDQSISDFMADREQLIILKPNQCLGIPTLEGEMLASKGDWIIRGVNNEIYPCKPDIFEKTYEKVT